MRHEVQPLLRGAWSGWLAQRPWDLFVTLTSDHRTHPEALHKRFRYCVHKISDELYGRSQTRRGCPIEYVNGIERHKSGWPHSHALLRIPNVDMSDRGQFSLGDWRKRLTDTGGYADLSRPINQALTLAYVCKYVTKDGDLELSPNLSPTADPSPPLFTPGQPARTVPRSRNRAAA